MAKAGWYPDPQGFPVERWWDGAQWTARTRAATPDHNRGLRHLIYFLVILAAVVFVAIRLNSLMNGG